MKKINSKRGFTMAELLIVVAIIAVLVAVLIPTFSAQLEKAREGVDLANIRSAIAECKAAALTAPSGVAGYYKEVELKQTNKDSWTIDTSGITDLPVPSSIAGVYVAKDGTVAFTAQSDYTKL